MKTSVVLYVTKNHARQCVKIKRDNAFNSTEEDYSTTGQGLRKRSKRDA